MCTMDSVLRDSLVCLDCSWERNRLHFDGYHVFFAVMLLWGGQTKAHSQAQEDSWHKILAFLNHHLYSNISVWSQCKLHLFPEWSSKTESKSPYYGFLLISYYVVEGNVYNLWLKGGPLGLDPNANASDLKTTSTLWSRLHAGSLWMVPVISSLSPDLSNKHKSPTTCIGGRPVTDPLVHTLHSIILPCVPYFQGSLLWIKWNSQIKVIKRIHNITCSDNDRLELLTVLIRICYLST